MNIISPNIKSMSIQITLSSIVGSPQDIFYTLGKDAALTFLSSGIE